MTAIYIVAILVSFIVLYKVFSGPIIVEKDTNLNSKTFEVIESGFYSIWIKGKMFKAVALDIRNAIIADVSDQKIKAIKSIFHPQVNGFKKGRTLLKYYYLKKGTYTIHISKDQEDSLGFFTKLLLRNSAHNKSTEYTYQLRKTLPEFLFPILLLGIVLPGLKLMEML